MQIRKPHVAGSFYPSDASELRQFFDDNLSPVREPVSAKAIMMPHAGYVYSGKLACHVISRVRVPGKVFLIGPNHHGLGAPFSVFEEGEWETPLGKTPVDSGLARALMKACQEIRSDDSAHLFEHSLEVLVPFLQIKNPQVQIVPLTVGTLDLSQAREVALACAKVLSCWEEPVLIAVSTDMSHYESDEATRKKDSYALRAIEALDEKALAKAVSQYRITMCGFVPVYMLLVMRNLLGFKRATLVDYRTSADASGDYDQVVGYAGFIFE